MTTDVDPRREHADRLIIEARRAGITSHRELANLLAQAEIETGHFTRFDEDLRYRPEGLLRVFRGRNGIDTLAEARAITEGGPEAVANAVYGGKWGHSQLGNTEPGDGWKFRGRGYFQITGRDNYEVMNTALAGRFGVDLVANPERIAEPAIAAAAAMEFWERNVARRGVQLDIDRATGFINAGRLDLDGRRRAAAEWERKLDAGYMAIDPDRPQPARPLDPTHPARSLFDTALSHLESIERERGIASGPHTVKLSLALTDQAQREGVDRIDRVELNERGTLVRAVQFSPIGDDALLNRKTEAVDIASALQAPEVAIAQRLETHERRASPELALALRETPRMAMSP